MTVDPLVQLALDMPAPAPADVIVDPRFGHIAVTSRGPHPADGAWCDLGSELHWWAHTSIRLDRDGARALAAALTAWADRRDPQEELT